MSPVRTWEEAIELPEGFFLLVEGGGRDRWGRPEERTLKLFYNGPRFTDVIESGGHKPAEGATCAHICTYNITEIEVGDRGVVAYFKRNIRSVLAEIAR